MASKRKAAKLKPCPTITMPPERDWFESAPTFGSNGSLELERDRISRDVKRGLYKIRRHTRAKAR